MLRTTSPGLPLAPMYRWAASETFCIASCSSTVSARAFGSPAHAASTRSEGLECFAGPRFGGTASLAADVFVLFAAGFFGAGFAEVFLAAGFFGAGFAEAFLAAGFFGAGFAEAFLAAGFFFFFVFFAPAFFDARRAAMRPR